MTRVGLGITSQHSGVTAGLGEGLRVAGQLVPLDEAVRGVPEDAKPLGACSR
jgi:hypothetical protein